LLLFSLLLTMNSAGQYIHDILGVRMSEKPIPDELFNHLPLYIRETYTLFYGKLYNRWFVLVVQKEDNDLKSSQIEKNLGVISNRLNEGVILVLNKISFTTRRMLIDKKIDFIVPGKQLFLPSLLLDLRETFSDNNNRRRIEKLLPSAQFVLLYHILHHYDKVPLTNLSFKELAEKFEYTSMAISLAVENLKKFDLCIVKGTKEKFIYFERQRDELWHMARPYLINPVLKRVFVDKKPDVFMMDSNVSALPEYSDISLGRQHYYAIEKKIYYSLQKNGMLVNENEEEGAYCIEVWKYDPAKLTQDITEESGVDPLSLYLSLKDDPDERIEMALDQIIDKYVW
jgi:hypothetical protein